MRVKEWVDGGLVLDGKLDAGVAEAFSEGRYVEAFALLHAQIDWWMADLYQLHRLKSRTVTPAEMQEMLDSHRYGFLTSAEYLHKAGIVTKVELCKLKHFNTLRNLIVHRLVVHSYQPRPRNKVTLAEVKAGFEVGQELAKLLAGKTGGIAFGRYSK